MPLRMSIKPMIASSEKLQMLVLQAAGMRIFWSGKIRSGSLITSRLASKIFGYLFGSCDQPTKTIGVSVMAGSRLRQQNHKRATNKCQSRDTRPVPSTVSTTSTVPLYALARHALLPTLSRMLTRL